LENGFKIINGSEDKTLFWRVQLLPLIWNRDYEDDTHVSVTSVIFWFETLALGSTTKLENHQEKEPGGSSTSQHSFSPWFFV